MSIDLPLTTFTDPIDKNGGSFKNTLVTEVGMDGDKINLLKVCDDQGQDDSDNDENLFEAMSEKIDRSNIDNATSNFQTFTNLIKGNIGLGILNMPVTFMHAGLWLGLGGLLFLGLVSTHCMHLLLYASTKLTRKFGTTEMDYHNIAEYCMKSGPASFERYASAFKNIVVVTIVFTQLGFCCVYILFIGRMLKEVTEDYREDLIGQYSIQFYVAVVLPFLILFCFIKSLRVMSVFAGIANVFCLWTMFVVFCNLFGAPLPFHPVVEPSTGVNFVEAVASVKTWPSFFGAAMFAFESIGLIMPIENKMRNPQAFRGWAGLLTLSMTVVVALDCAVGVFGYWRNGVRSRLILSSLPRDNLFYLSAKVLFAAAIFVTYNLQFYVVVKLLLPRVKTLFRVSDRCSTPTEYALRVVLIVATAGIALAVPCLEEMISFVGAVASASLAIIFPPFINCVLHHDAPGRYCWTLFAKDIGLIVFGLLGAVAGTCTSAFAIYDKLSAHGSGCGH